MKLLKHSVQQSRFLRVLFLVALFGWALLIWTLLTTSLDWQVASILLIFHVGSWYFALATRAGFATLWQPTDPEKFARLSSLVDSLCLGILVFCQALFLITVFRLRESL